MTRSEISPIFHLCRPVNGKLGVEIVHSFLVSSSLNDVGSQMLNLEPEDLIECESEDKLGSLNEHTMISLGKAAWNCAINS